MAGVRWTRNLFSWSSCLLNCGHVVTPKSSAYEKDFCFSTNKSPTFPSTPAHVFTRRSFTRCESTPLSHSLFKFLHLSSETAYEKDVLMPAGFAAQRGPENVQQQHFLPQPLTIKLQWALKPVALSRLDWIIDESRVWVMKN